MGLVVESAESGAERRAWHRERGDLILWSPVPGVLRVDFRGHIVTEFAPLLDEGLAAAIERAGTIEVFFDFEHAACFEPGYRRRIVETIRRHTARVTLQHLYIESAAIRSGVFILGLMAHMPPTRTYGDRGSFEASFTQHVARLRPAPPPR